MAEDPVGFELVKASYCGPRICISDHAGLSLGHLLPSLLLLLTILLLGHSRAHPRPFISEKRSSLSLLWSRNVCDKIVIVTTSLKRFQALYYPYNSQVVRDRTVTPLEIQVAPASWWFSAAQNQVVCEQMVSFVTKANLSLYRLSVRADKGRGRTGLVALAQRRGHGGPGYKLRGYVLCHMGRQ